MSAAANQAAIPTPATPDVATYKVLVEGQEISSAYHLLSLVVSLEVNRIASATLHFKDGEAAKQTFAISNTPEFVPGKEIEIKLGYKAQDKRVFKGIVIKQSLKIRANGSQLVVECKDKAVQMTLTRRSQYYNQQKESEIWEQLIGRHGLTKNVKPTTQTFEDVVQYNTTDWDFLVCRADAHGMAVTVEEGKVNIAPLDLQQAPTLVVQYGSALLELDVEMDARTQSESLKAYTWDSANQALVEVEAKDPTGTPNGNISGKELGTLLHHTDQHLYHGGTLTTPELKAWADAQMLRNRLAKVRGRTRFQGFADLKPTQIIEIKGIGQRFEGKVFVSAVRHQLSSGNWETDVQFGLHPQPFAEQNDLNAPRASALRPAVSGLQIGIVTKLEGDPDGEDRIKIKLPLVSTDAEGSWARIATLDAGNERGMYFRPEIGDEVLVGFMNDDPNYPVILGMCHSSNHPAPVPPKDSNHQKGYVSRSKMKWVFDDDKKSITIETPAGNQIVISEDEKSIHIQDQNGNKILMNDGGIQIESSKDLILKAAKDIKIEGMQVNIKATMSLKAEGTATTEISGATTSIKGSAATVIKGGIVQIN